MNKRNDPIKAIRPEMTVRQIASDWPATQAVFEAHGEQPAGRAKFGHLEPLAHFARRRGVALVALLDELSTAAGAPVDFLERVARKTHRGFILGALLVTLTLGAGWGVWLLLQIGVRADFAAATAAQVIAHGEAQLWGFIVLFVMGISLRTALRDVSRRPRGLVCCRALLLLALFGVAGSTVWSLFPQTTTPLGIASAGALCLLSASWWGLQLRYLFGKRRQTWARAIMVSGMWLFAWALLTLYLRCDAGAAGPGTYSREQRLLLVNLAVFGFAMNSIYGFGHLLLPGLLRIGSLRQTPLEAAHWLHNLGTLCVSLATVWPSARGLMLPGSLLLISGGVMFAIGQRAWRGRHRKLRQDVHGQPALDWYPRLAFGWLLVGLLLLTFSACHEWLTSQPPSHAYTGAVRHALTVGFMTTLILGVGQRMIPVIENTILALPRLVIPILLLIGLGNLWRVTAELAVLATPLAFHAMPTSSLLEWTALLLFSINIAATMFRRDPLLKRGIVTMRSSLAVLLAEYPEIEDRLRPQGSGYLQRTRSVPRELTLRAYASKEGLDPTQLIADINRWLQQPGSPAGNHD